MSRYELYNKFNRVVRPLFCLSCKKDDLRITSIDFKKERVHLKCDAYNILNKYTLSFNQNFREAK